MLVQKVDDVLHIEMSVPLYAAAVFMTAHHHYLRLVEAVPCDDAYPGVAKLVKANVLRIAQFSPCPSEGL